MKSKKLSEKKEKEIEEVKEILYKLELRLVKLR